jgi:hypothetical protein
MADTVFSKASLTDNSSGGGVVIVTIAETPASISPSAQPCRSCLVQQKAGTQCYMNIDATCTTSHWKLSSTSPIPVPVQNLSQLYFIGTAADTIQILWRN